ncbi:protein kinase domain protein [Puccinia sorghi]|uniref:Protein kinase domain protein n=1 Tax=Puccinia sorghi TaxID=27349 RepID=A0A0L6UTZ1_9BASI|nr:protein kinase domain protein [Puccinia sorghi]
MILIGIFYSDLKPDSFWIDHRRNLKLTDFGLSKISLLGQ